MELPGRGKIVVRCLMLTPAAGALLYLCIRWLCLQPEYFPVLAVTLLNAFLIYSFYFHTEL